MGWAGSIGHPTGQGLSFLVIRNFAPATYGPIDKLNVLTTHVKLLIRNCDTSAKLFEIEACGSSAAISDQSINVRGSRGPQKERVLAPGNGC